MPIRETGKQRAARIPPDYFKGFNPLDHGRAIAAGIAALVAIGWWGVGTLANRADSWVSPAPLAAAHATWENHCNACHTPLTPIRDDAWSKLLVAGLHVNDEKCEKCHNTSLGKANPMGHHPATNSDQLACATCHHEHLGRSHTLARTDDASCTMCHGSENLGTLRVGPSVVQDGSPLAKVTRFYDDHPDFRSIIDLTTHSPKPDPRKLKFGAAAHHVHLNPGLRLHSNQKPTIAVGDLSQEAQDRYKLPDQQPKDLVQLNCGSCHQLDARDFHLKQVDNLPNAVLPAQSAGAHMLPIVYENQCRACHPLTIEADDRPAAKENGRSNSKAIDVVPHRLRPEQLVTEVWSYWVGRYFRDNPKQLDRTRPLPDRSTELEDPDARQFVDTNVKQSLKHLQRVCAECHELDEKAVITLSKEYERFQAAFVPVRSPVAIPQNWFEHARFVHSAHGAISCLECHAKADPKSPLTDADLAFQTNNDGSKPAPMIPSRDVCLRCHSPRQESSDPPQGGARFDCAECHQYHHHQPAELAGQGKAESAQTP